MAKQHTVAEGDCIESIALLYGFHPDTLWSHEANRELREARADAHVLRPDDVLTIPEIRVKTASCATGKLHRFRRRGVPATFHLVLRHRGEPRADVDYTLTVEDREHSGRTGPDGVILHWISPAARTAVLSISETEQYEFQLGCLQPAGEEASAFTRLKHLGYLPLDVDEDEVDDDILEIAILEFQADQGIEEPSGVFDEETCGLLAKAHGS